MYMYFLKAENLNKYTYNLPMGKTIKNFYYLIQQESENGELEN